MPVKAIAFAWHWVRHEPKMKRCSITRFGFGKWSQFATPHTTAPSLRASISHDLLTQFVSRSAPLCLITGPRQLLMRAATPFAMKLLVSDPKLR